MNNEPFDSKLKSRLNESVSEVPEHLWAAVEAKLITPPRRRRFPFYFIIGTILVLSGMAYIGWQKTEAIHQAMTQEFSREIRTDRPVLDNSAKKKSPPLMPTTGLLTKEDDKNNSELKVEAITISGQVKKKLTAQMQEPGIQQVLYNSNTAVNEYFVINAAPRPLNMENEQGFYNSPFASITSQKPLESKIATPIMPTPFIHATKDQQISFTMPDRPMASIACPPVNGPGRKQGWFIEPYGGIFLPVNQTDYKTGIMSNNDTVSSSVVPQPSFQGGFMVGTYIAPGKSLKAGLQYSRWNEQFRYSNLSERQTTTTITIRTVYLSNGDSLRVQDTTIVEQLGRRTVRTNNRLQSIEVPVIVGFEWGNHTRWSANVGIIASIRSAYEGKMADSLNKPVPIDEGLYRQSMGIGIHAGLALMQPVGQRLQLVFEPHVRINLNNEAANSAWFRQRRMMGGINAGLRYRLR